MLNKPGAKLGIFSQNDDAGRDYVRGLKDALGDKASTLIVKELTYETTDSTIDSQIVTLKAAGAIRFSEDHAEIRREGDPKLPNWAGNR